MGRGDRSELSAAHLCLEHWLMEVSTASVPSEPFCSNAQGPERLCGLGVEG